MKKLRILKLLFILALAFPLGGALVSTAILATPQEAKAADPAPLDYYPQVQLPVSGSGLNQASTAVGSYKDGVMSSDLLARYIKAIYDYGLMIGGILAAIVLMGGGVLWLTSGGNDSKVTQAKELISGSITGLVILFSSWVILNTINPDLLQLQILKTKVINVVTLEGIECQWRCVPVGQKCEGGGGHDAIQATSQWRSNKQDYCLDNIGAMPTNACPTGQLYDCCCRNKYDIPAADGDAMLACLKGTTGNAFKEEGSDCYIQSTGVSGYCKTVKKDGSANYSKCMPCLQIGEKCTDNMGDYECADSNGKCGSTHGDCNSYAPDSEAYDNSVTDQIFTYISGNKIKCNSLNDLTAWGFNWILGTSDIYVECKCE
ncbi:MAG: pilin [Patescibacteria group bacterium]